MSLPIDSIRTLADDTTPSVVVTLGLPAGMENRTYPGCYATWSKERHVPGSELMLFAYADGRGAPPRARWVATAVIGTEHYGDHMQYATKPQQAPQDRHAVPAAGPDYPQTLEIPAGFQGVKDAYTAPVTHVVPLETTPEEVEARVKALSQTVMGFPSTKEETPPGSSSGTEDQPETTSTQEDSSLPDPESSTFWTPEDSETPEPEEEGWKPRTRPTAHREAKLDKAPAKSRGATKRAVRGAGMALLLGFALLGFSPR